jgi:hypothetical protein
MAQATPLLGLYQPKGSDSSRRDCGEQDGVVRPLY